MGLAYGEKGERVVEFQKGLLALEFALPRYGADGDYGGETLVAARAAAATFGIPMPTKDVPPALFAVITSRCPAAPSPGLTLGAWCGAKTLANPTRDIDTAVDLGLNRIDLVVNDHSAWRKPSHFSLRDHSKIMKVAQLARDAGLELNLMSWVMPHEAYIREAAVDLIPLARETGAASIQWDAEEPWVKAVNPMPYDKAAALLRDLFSPSAIPLSTNAIGYASVEKVGPLLAISAEGIPQCYSTSSSGVAPERVDELLKRWIRVFSTNISPTRLTCGLAAYRQTGIAGHTVTTAMQTALAEARAVGINRFVYWHLDDLRRNTAAGNVVRATRAAETGQV